MIQIKALAKWDNRLTTFFEPIESCCGEITLNKYFGFNCWKKNGIQLGKKYLLDLKVYNEDVKYGVTYKIIKYEEIK